MKAGLIFAALAIALATARDIPVSYDVDYDSEETLHEVPVQVPERRRLATGCALHVNTDLPTPQPLILNPGTDQYRYPSSDQFLTFGAGEYIELACANGFNLFPDKPSIMVSCVMDDLFNFDSQMFAFHEFGCTANWRSVARRTGERCFNQASIIEIGFDMGTRFPKVLDICHDEDTFENYYVKHEFTPSNAGFQNGVARPGWIQGEFYPGITVNTQYTVNTQRETIATILSSQERADVLVQTTNNGIYMARGHIAARADFIYATQQNATFWFLNVAPQWQNFNAGNWERIEASSKSFVAMRNIRVTVYGGTYGVQTQADANGDHLEIYLDFDPNGRSRLPAPKVYYKILHDEANNAGIVLIGVNNVHITIEEIRRDYIFCQDVSAGIGWINWERENLARGYSYACEVNEFNRVTGHLPHLNVANLLI